MQSVWMGIVGREVPGGSPWHLGLCPAGPRKIQGLNAIRGTQMHLGTWVCAWVDGPSIRIDRAAIV